VDVWMDG